MSQWCPERQDIAQIVRCFGIFCISPELELINMFMELETELIKWNCVEFDCNWQNAIDPMFLNNALVCQLMHPKRFPWTGKAIDFPSSIHVSDATNEKESVLFWGPTIYSCTSQVSIHPWCPYIPGVHTSQVSIHPRCPYIPGIHTSQVSIHPRDPYIPGVHTSQVSKHPRCPWLEWDSEVTHVLFSVMIIDY